MRPAVTTRTGPAPRAAADPSGGPRIALGQASLTGRRERNEDFHGCITPDGEALRAKGICAVVADGVGGALGGLEAAQSAVRSFLLDYYSTPPTWGVPVSVYRVLEAVNRWVHAEGRRNPRLAGMATTFSALVLKDRHYHTAHVGDSRIYLMRGDAFRRLTTDHTRGVPGLPAALTRAIGLDASLHLETRTAELAVGDRFLFVTDGASDVLPDARLAELLGPEDPQTACDRIVQAAYEAGGTDNITAQVVDVTALPDRSLADLGEGIRDLPTLGRLPSGHTLDGFRIEALLHRGRTCYVYRARDERTGRRVALKFLRQPPTGDPAALDRFLLEEWVGRRVDSPNVVRALPLEPGRRSALYFALDYVEGVTLAARLARRGALPAADVAEIGRQLARALSDLHRLGLWHRDVKPENAILGPDGTVTLSDLGTIRAEARDTGQAPAAGPPGTPSYMAPELFRGEEAGEQGDVYALGVTLYHLLTRHYPYGEVEPFSHPAFGAPAPVARYRPDVPPWLARVIETAVERDPGRRYRKITALLYDLEHPDTVAVPARPLLERDPVRFWRGACLLMGALAAALLVLLLR